MIQLNRRAKTLGTRPQSLDYPLRQPSMPAGARTVSTTAQKARSPCASNFISSLPEVAPRSGYPGRKEFRGSSGDTDLTLSTWNAQFIPSLAITSMKKQTGSADMEYSAPKNQGLGE
jgi:hypothetical protein